MVSQGSKNAVTPEQYSTILERVVVLEKKNSPRSESKIRHVHGGKKSLCIHLMRIDRRGLGKQGWCGAGLIDAERPRRHFIYI